MAGEVRGRLGRVPCGAWVRTTKTCAVCRTTGIAPGEACPKCGRQQPEYCEARVLPGARCKHHFMAPEVHPDAPTEPVDAVLARLPEGRREAVHDLLEQDMGEIAETMAALVVDATLLDPTPDAAQQSLNALYMAARTRSEVAKANLANSDAQTTKTTPPSVTFIIGDGTNITPPPAPADDDGN